MINWIFDNLFMVTLCVLGLGATAYSIFYRRLVHRLLIRDLRGEDYSPMLRRVMEYKDKNGILWWLEEIKFPFKYKKRVAPPSTFVKTMFNGKKYAEALRDGQDNYTYCTPKVLNNEIKMQGLSTNETLLYLDQLRQAELHKRKTLAEWIFQAAPILGLVLVVAMIFSFWSDIGKPLLDYHDKQVAMETIHTEQLKVLRDIKNNMQTPSAINPELPKEAPN